MSELITLKLDFFGPVKDLTGKSDDKIYLVRKSDEDSLTVASSSSYNLLPEGLKHVEEMTISLWALLNALDTYYGLHYRLLKYVMRSCGIAIDYEYVDIPARVTNLSEEDLTSAFKSTTVSLTNGCEVSIIPPVSSG